MVTKRFIFTITQDRVRNGKILKKSQRIDEYPIYRYGLQTLNIQIFWPLLLYIYGSRL